MRIAGDITSFYKEDYRKVWDIIRESPLRLASDVFYDYYSKKAYGLWRTPKSQIIDSLKKVIEYYENLEDDSIIKKEETPSS